MKVVPINGLMATACAIERTVLAVPNAAIGLDDDYKTFSGLVRLMLDVERGATKAYMLTDGKEAMGLAWAFWEPSCRICLHCVAHPHTMTKETTDALELAMAADFPSGATVVARIVTDNARAIALASVCGFVKAGEVAIDGCQCVEMEKKLPCSAS